MGAREDVLRRITTALNRPAHASTPEPAPIPRDYRQGTGQQPGSAELVALFTDRLEDYKATVHKAAAVDVRAVLRAVMEKESAAVVPAGLPQPWRAAIADSVAAVHVDGQPRQLSAAELDDVGVVVTGCRVAIAETGTIVLDGEPDQGRRAITLVPDHHVVVVLAEQIVASVPEAIARLDPNRPLTFISGPSATSDIEFNRVEGVHGPRRLDVIVVTDGSS